MKENVKSIIVEIIAATIFFGGISWIFDLISGKPDSTGCLILIAILKCLLFGVLIVLYSRWYQKRKKDKEQ